MKKHTIYRGALLSAGLLLAADGILRATRHRSLAAAAIEKALPLYTKSHTLSPEELRANLQAEQSRPPEVYTFPSALHLAHPPTLRTFEGRNCFLMSGAGDSDLTVLYLHGGSYIEEFTPFHWQWLDKLCRETGAEILCPDYPLAPQSTAEVSLWLLTRLYTHLLETRPTRRFVLMGDSAGGGLALALAQKFRAEGVPSPAATVLLSPWPDATMSNPAIADYEALDPMLRRENLKICGEFWAGSLDPADPRANPLFGEMEGLSHVLITVGTHELFYPDVTALYAKLQSADVDCRLLTGEGLNHVYPFFPIPEANTALKEIVRWIKPESNT